MQTLRIEVPRAFRPLLAPARYKGAYGGRGGAKSHFLAGLLIARCLQQPIRAVCVREVQRSLEQSVKRLLEDKIQAMGVGGLFRVLNTHIETPGGGVIIFQGMQNHTAESIKSLEGYDLAWVEEAQALSQTSLDLLRPTIRKPGSELWFSWNPRKATDPVDAMFRGGEPPPGAVVAEVGWRDNPWFPEVLREEMEWDHRRDPAKYAHIWGGDYRKRTDELVFRLWEEREFDTPPGAKFYYGADWGFSVDPAVLVRAWIDGRKLYVDQEASAIGVEIDYLPFLFGGCQDEELGQLNRDAWESMPDRYKSWRGVDGARRSAIIADSARPETISHLRRRGFPLMEESKKGPGSVEEGIEFLRSYDIVVHPRCRRVIDELSTYSYKVIAKTGEVTNDLEDRKNHTIDSLRYAVEKLRRNVVGGFYG